MNKKALREKKAMLEKELRTLLDVAIVENRGLEKEENSKMQEIESELAEIENKLGDIENDVEKEQRKVNGEKDMNKEKREFYQGLAKGEIRTVVQGTGEVGDVSLGNTVPETLVQAVVKMLDEKGQIAKDCQIMNVKGDVKIFAEKDVVGYAQVLGENEIVAETNINDLNVITLGTKRVGDLIVVSKQLLMNSPIVAEQMILEQLSKRVDNVLARDILKGDGLGANLTGLLTLKDDANVGVVESGGDLIDDLLDMTLDIHPTLLNGCKFYMSRARFKAISKLKDANKQYYVIRDIVNGMPQYKLFGFDIVISDEANDTEIMFANLKEAMVLNIQQNMEMQVLKEAYARANAVGILVNMHLDNAIRNKQAVRILKQVQA